MERTLILVKPDAVQRCLIGNVISCFENWNLKIVAIKMIQADDELARKHYGVHKEKDFFEGLVEFITSGPVIAMVLEAENAVREARYVMEQVREIYSTSIRHNVVHGSDSLETAKEEIELWFEGEV